MKLSRTDEFFAKALTRGPKRKSGADSDAAEESASASYQQKAQRPFREWFFDCIQP
jgi:hypothetical protein